MTWKGGAYATWPGNWIFGPTENLFAWAFEDPEGQRTSAAVVPSSSMAWFAQMIWFAQMALFVKMSG